MPPNVAPPKPLPGNLELFRAHVPDGIKGERMLALLVFTRSIETMDRIAQTLKIERRFLVDHLHSALRLLRDDPAFHRKFHSARNSLPQARFH